MRIIRATNSADMKKPRETIAGLYMSRRRKVADQVLAGFTTTVVLATVILPPGA